MDENTIIDQLEELAGRFGIQIRYEPIKQDEDLVKVVGGLCILRGEYVIIIDSKAAMRDKIRTLAEAVAHFDLDRIYIKPALREILRKVSP
jgi:chromosome condensin MukBEF complex kleisin-like MukF subunit